MQNLQATQNMEDNSNNNASDKQMTGLLKIYTLAVKNVPILKYSWVIAATICLLALAAYYKLSNSDVFFYAFAVLFISLFGFLFSYLLRTKDNFIKFLLYILLSTIVVTIGAAVLSFGSFILWEKPKFYSRWFPDNNKVVTPDTISRELDSLQPVPDVVELTPEQLNDSAEAAYNIFDYKRALDYYKRSADMGNSKGEYKYGQMYEFGHGVKEDAVEAAKWYIKSANQGNAVGQFKLGYIYEVGYGTKKDIDKAVYWLTKSAENGNDFAQLELGNLYYNGTEINKDLNEAARLYRQSAESNNIAGQNNLGMMYEQGFGGLEKDLYQAKIWYQKSADQNNDLAIANLKRVNQLLSQPSSGFGQ